MITFQPTGTPKIEGVLVYVEADYSFDFEPQHAADTDSELYIRTLSIGANSSDGLLTSVFGYSPRQSWTRASADKPVAVPFRIRLTDPSVLTPGVGRHLNSDVEWHPTFDEEQGIVELRSVNSQEVSHWYEVASGVFIGLDGKRTVAAVSLEPKFR